MAAVVPTPLLNAINQVLGQPAPAPAPADAEPVDENVAPAAGEPVGAPAVPTAAPRQILGTHNGSRRDGERVVLGDITSKVVLAEDVVFPFLGSTPRMERLTVGEFDQLVWQ